MFFLRSGTRCRCPFLPLLLNTVLKLIATAIRQEREICKRIPLERKKSLFTYEVIIYVENPIEFKKLLKIINVFSKASGWNFNIQNPVLFLYSRIKCSIDGKQQYL